MRRSRRSRRQRENENPMIEAIKWYQGRVVRVMVFGLLPLSLLFAGFAWWIGTPAGRDFTGWTEHNRQADKELESLKNDMEKKYNEFTESTNEDVQNTIDEIEGTQDTSGTEYYSEDPYTAPETQESVEQPTQESNGANNSTSERPKKTVESYDTEVDNSQAESPQDNLPEPAPDESKQLDNNYLGPTKGELNGYDEWLQEDKEKYYSWDEQKRQAYEESIYREEE